MYSVQDLYPNHDILLIGHSLGATLASLVGRTLDLPVIAFGSPGDSLAMNRLHILNFDQVERKTWHFGHTADPIYMGECNVNLECIFLGYNE